MWDQVQTNKMVGYLFPNDADGQAWSNPDTRAGAYPGQGRLHDRLQAGDVPAAVGGLHRSRSPSTRRLAARSARGSDAARLHHLLAAVRSAGLSAEDPQHEQGPSLPPEHRGCGRHRYRHLRPHGLASEVPLQELPHRSDLRGVRRGVHGRDRRAVDAASRPAGQVRVGGRRAQACTRHREQGTVRRSDQGHEVRGHQRPGRLQPAGPAGHRPPGPERVQDQDRRRPVGQVTRIPGSSTTSTSATGMDPNMPIEKEFEPIPYA